MAFQSKLYASWETGSMNDLEYATFNGTSWSSPASLGIDSDAGPALAVKDKHLYESWINYSNLDVDYSSFNGTTWSATKIGTRRLDHHRDWSSSYYLDRLAGCRLGPRLLTFGN